MSNLLSASSKALHWSAIRDLSVAADIAGAGASGEFAPSGVEPYQIYGSALGTPGAGGHSGYGIFTDENGNTICIATESRSAWGMIWGKDLLGKNPYVFRIPRNMGQGGAYEANAFMIAGIEQRYGGYEGWSRIETSEIDKINGVTFNRYNNFPDLLSQIENTGKKYDRPIVLLSSGEPITFASVLNQALTLILAVAKPFASFIGIPPLAFDVIANSLNTIATQGKFTIDTLANAAQLIVPMDFRSIIPQAKNIYSAIDKGNYLDAMQGLGITGNIAGVTKSLLGGDISALLEKSNLGYQDIVGTVQNLFQFDTIRSLSAANRSGSVISNLIDAGTMTRVPVLQNLLTATTTDTLTSAIPGVSEIMQNAINQTNDIANVDLHKGAIQSALGHIVGQDTFDDLTLRGLKEKANSLLENGVKQFVMPIVIPLDKRLEFAQIIADDVKIQVLADAVGGKVTTPSTYYQEWN